jgi:hypothetical protein
MFKTLTGHKCIDFGLPEPLLNIQQISREMYDLENKKLEGELCQQNLNPAQTIA